MDISDDDSKLIDDGAGTWDWCTACRTYHHDSGDPCVALVLQRQHPREDDMTTPLGQIVYGNNSDPRWETTQEIPRGDVMTAVRLAYQDTSKITHPVLDLLVTSEPVVPAAVDSLGYNPYDTARVVKWDRRKAQMARTQKMARQARVMFGTRARRVLNLRGLKEDIQFIAWLDVMLAVLGVGCVLTGWLAWQHM